MHKNDDELIALRELDEECPGPNELESALSNDTLGEVETQPPLVLESSTSLADTNRLMQAERRACALLVEDGRLAGIFTERDVLMKLAGSDIDLERTAVAEAMTRDPVTFSTEASVAQALNMMVVEGFRHIPLVDERGHPTGMVSMRDLIDYLTDFFGKDVLNLPPDPSGSFRSRDGA